MKNYTKPDGSVRAFEDDGSQDYLITADMVPITAAEAFALLNPPPSLESLKAEAIAEVKALRTAFFSILAGLQSEALTLGNQSLALAIATIQQGGKLITQTDLSACTTKAEIDTAFYNAWLSLVVTAPAEVITAFKSVKS